MSLLSDCRRKIAFKYERHKLSGVLAPWTNAGGQNYQITLYFEGLKIWHTPLNNL